MKKNLYGPGRLRVELDTEQVFPDDPGNGTPAMVFLPFGRGCSTYWCAREVGTVDGGQRGGEIPLTDAQCEWLWSIEDAVEDFIHPKENVNGILDRM